jgi:hypothetical protein
MKTGSRLFMWLFLLLASLTTLPSYALAINMNEAAANMSREMDAQLALRFGSGSAVSNNISVIVTTPVDINNFEESSAMARQMQEYLSYWLVQAGYSVQEVRKGKALLFRQEAGELLLTRNRELAAYKKVNSVLTLVGTYTVTSKSIIFNMRLMQTGGLDVYAMSSVSIPVTGETRALLSYGSGSSTGNTYISIEPSVYSRLP